MWSGVGETQAQDRAADHNGRWCPHTEVQLVKRASLSSDVVWAWNVYPISNTQKGQKMEKIFYISFMLE